MYRYRLIVEDVCRLHELGDCDGLRANPLRAGGVRQPGTDIVGRQVGQCRMIFDAEYNAELHRVVFRRNKRSVRQRSDAAHRV